VSEASTFRRQLGQVVKAVPGFSAASLGVFSEAITGAHEREETRAYGVACGLTQTEADEVMAAWGMAVERTRWAWSSATVRQAMKRRVLGETWHPRDHLRVNGAWYEEPK